MKMLFWNITVKHIKLKLVIDLMQKDILIEGYKADVLSTNMVRFLYVDDIPIRICLFKHHKKHIQLLLKVLSDFQLLIKSVLA